VRAFFVAVILALGMTAAAQSLRPSSGQAVTIQLEGNLFKVAGAKPGATLVVYAGAGDVPPLAGRLAVDNGGALVFRPQFPLGAGVRYRAVYTPPGGPAIEKTFDTAARNATPVARVEHLYPSADALPSNQLRLYIYFSAPMSRGEAEQRVHLLDAAGKPLPKVFLPGQELWDPLNRRLTMTFDPGRIKRDLVSNRAMGPPLVAGRRYTLLIDREWRDANGNPMVEPFRKIFRGGPAVRQPPDPKTWKIAAPARDSRAPLVVSFDRPMNYTLLQRMLKVSDARGTMSGIAEVVRSETEWRFTPVQPWAAGAYSLVVDNGLEDLAGNKIGQLFDIDVFSNVTERITTTTTTLPFEIRSHP
jgi:hypothetical protein